MTVAQINNVSHNHLIAGMTQSDSKGTDSHSAGHEFLADFTKKKWKLPWAILIPATASHPASAV